MGCGIKTTKAVWETGQPNEFEGEIVRLDINKDVNPDIVWDLRIHPLPFNDDEFDEIHAYHILEHLAQQGDWEFFFNEWNEYYRILKPGGKFFGVVPVATSKWAWGDPGHTRVFPKQYFIYLNRDSYLGCSNGNPLTDYRFIYKGDFELTFMSDSDQLNLAFILKARNG